jgi:hypothetical protein
VTVSEQVGKHLHHVAPDREDELLAAMRARAEEIAEDVDKQGSG